MDTENDSSLSSQIVIPINMPRVVRSILILHWYRIYSLTNDNRHQWLSQPDEEHALHKAGYAVTYDKFQFITINGAGHMVSVPE